MFNQHTKNKSIMVKEEEANNKEEYIKDENEGKPEIDIEDMEGDNELFQIVLDKRRNTKAKSIKQKFMNKFRRKNKDINLEIRFCGTEADIDMLRT